MKIVKFFFNITKLKTDKDYFLLMFYFVRKILKNNKGIIGIRKIILYLILSGTITVGFLSSVS